ncbi:MAG TPA: hypothetical protein VHF01_11110 [Candidatus Acidoferrum sp.]|nr:hypothetical protein [Candidatus Acidoferrum sp.]
MLKPYVCVACEKVILAGDGVASLIGLFSKFVVVVPAETEIPKNAVAPKEWAIFAIFDTDPGDELKEYFLFVQILYPDKSQFGETSKTKIKTELNKRSQVVAQIPAFPLGQVGNYTVRVWVEENQQKVVGPIEFKIELEIIKQAQKTP